MRLGKNSFRRWTAMVGLVFLGANFATICPGAVFHPPKKTKNSERDFINDIKPLLAKYCYGCHGETKKKGDLSLQDFATEAAVLNSKPVWEKVLHHVQTREMPPENKPQPSETERDRIAQWIEAKVFQCDCAHPDPGRVTLRRLNRAEYNNTIRDLLGVDFHPANDFPADDSGYGFDNIGDVLSLSPILLEKYMRAAEKILDKAIVADFSTNGPTLHFEAEKFQTDAKVGARHGTFFKLTRESEISTNVDFSGFGNYLLRARAYGEQAGDEPAKMEVRINDEAVATFDVTAEEDAPAVYEVHFQSGPGVKKMGAAYINNFVDRDAADPSRRDRNLVIDYLEIIGPPGPPRLPASHQRLFPQPVPGSLSAQKNYARQILGEFASRAYRRPATAAETERLLGFYELARSDGENFPSSVKLALQAILVSPHFLFRGEWQSDPNNSKSVHSIDEFALASRLSYFLWSSTPDGELLELAGRGKLRKNLEAQVRRLLRDQKSSALVENFSGQWLQIRNLKFVAPDPDDFPQFDEELRAAMQKETELFFAALLRGNGGILDLLDADYTFLNEKLARLYGIAGVSGEEFRRVSLRGTARAGILTHASVLTLTSNPTRTSPVKRGKWILENILGAPPPPPPPNVPELKEGKALTGALRERMEQHRADPNCASCHARMDPIGFAFEHFDGIGAWRKQDGDSPIDTTGQLVSGESFRDAVELRKILVTQKKEDFVRCLAGKLLTYALGRGLEMYDRCALDEISKSVAKNNYRFDDLILAVVNSVPFQQRRGEDRLTNTSVERQSRL